MLPKIFPFYDLLQRAITKLTSEDLRKQQDQTKYQGFKDRPMLSSMAHLCPLMAKSPGEKRQSKAHFHLLSQGEFKGGRGGRCGSREHVLPSRRTRVWISEMHQGEGCATRNL